MHSVGSQVQADIPENKVQPPTVVNDVVQSNKSRSPCNENSASYRCDDGDKHIISDKTYQEANKEHSEAIAIKASKRGTHIMGKNITIKDASNTDSSGKNFWKYSVVADNSGKIDIEKGEMYVTNGVAVYTEKNGMIYLKNVSVTKNNSQETNGDNHDKNSAFQMSKNENFLDFKEGNVKVINAHGVSLRGNVNDLNIIDSTFVVEGNAFYGFRFWEEKDAEVQPYENPYTTEQLYSFYGENVVFGNLPRTNLPMRGYVDLQKTFFQVPKGTVIYSNKSGALLEITQNSRISGDLLLKGENGSLVKISADASTLVGGVRLDKSSTAEFRLRSGSKWILLQPKYEKLQDSHPIGASSISLMHLIDSSIIFEEPKTNTADGYQTLHIGKGSGTVYEAEGEAHVYLNTYLNKGGKLQEQKTDRLLIHGDVSGKTILHIRSVAGSPGGATGLEGNNKGISVVQVHGSAQEDSFQLAGGYVTLENSPYQYRLHAYGVSSRLGKTSSAQKLVESGGEFWDFRLENGNIDFYIPSKPAPGSGVVPGPHLRPDDGSEFVPDSHLRPAEPGARAVVPQVSTYLLLSNSVFHAGLVDISNQNKQLEMLRTTSSGMVEVRERPALYLHSYGGRYRYHSDLSTLEYGYGGNLNYNAVETGVLLQTIENTTSILSLGVLGSYGKLSLQPLNVEHSQESAFDKWTATVYGSMQHDNGFYVDGLFSYGLLKGDVRTSVRGRTATLKGKPFSVSLTGGQAFAIGYESFVLDPQVQVIYQRLQFSNARDVDNFDIELGGLNQWVARVGGRLIKVPKNYEGMNSIALYGKVYLAHGFGERQAVRFKDSFQLGNFGSTLEAGLGFNARLSGNLVLHADMVYQRKLTKAGFSGASFSGGVHYRF